MEFWNQWYKIHVEESYARTTVDKTPKMRNVLLMLKFDSQLLNAFRSQPQERRNQTTDDPRLMLRV